MDNIDNLLSEYITEFRRTTGKNASMSYNRGWFVMPNGDKKRKATVETMLATLKTRPTLSGRQELVNGVLTLVKASQHVVKSLMPPHKDVIEERDTPWNCSVASETYWST